MARGLTTNFSVIYAQVTTAVRNPTELDWSGFHAQYKNRIFFSNLGTDGQDIGAEPTKMYESEDMRNEICIDNIGVTTKDYYEHLEKRYGIIYDPDDNEMDIIAKEWAAKAVQQGYTTNNTC